MLNSMTGFSAKTGAEGAWKWSWDIRSVNARGLDIRLRIPDWIQGLETDLRARVRKGVGRGAVSVSLRLMREDAGASEIGLAPEAVTAALDALATIEAAAQTRNDIDLAPTSAFDVLQLIGRGKSDDALNEAETHALAKMLAKDFDRAFDDFLASRRGEGVKLHKVLQDQVAQIAQLTEAATKAAVERADGMAANFRRALERLVGNSDKIDVDRVHQEIALLAVKADVTEELDRLRLHVAAAHELFATDGPVGRKLDFLTQEFNREANTLCSKSQWPEITRIGLDLKAAVDQMREQVQNVE